jgi:hypothetical protein
MPSGLRDGRDGFRAFGAFFAREVFFGADRLRAPVLFAAAPLPAPRFARRTFARPLLRPRFAVLERDPRLDRFFFFAIVLLLPLTALSRGAYFPATHLAHIG